MAVLSWNEILQKDKQTQMTGAQGLSPEQLGALRSAELTEGSVNARNIFNQNEINRRNAVAEKQASDMMRSNKSAQNMGAAIKLGTMATEYYPQIKEAVGGAYNYITGASNAEQTAASELASAVGAGTSAYEGASAAYQGVSAANAMGLSTSVGNTVGSEGVLALGETGTMGSAAAAQISMLTPATAGFAAGTLAPTVLNAIHTDSTENLGHNLSLGAIRHEKTSRQVGGTAAGAVAGAAAGAAATSWSGPGAIVGAVVGGIGGLVAESCIIVTACTDRNSYEVEITRQYRDKFLTGTQLRGYYWAAEKLVPTIENNTTIRNLVKKQLVDKLVDYGEMKLGLKDSCKLSSKIVSNLFLGLIKTVGIIIPEYTRLNGEIY